MTAATVAGIDAMLSNVVGLSELVEADFGTACVLGLVAEVFFAVFVDAAFGAMALDVRFAMLAGAIDADDVEGAVDVEGAAAGLCSAG